MLNTHCLRLRGVGAARPRILALAIALTLQASGTGFAHASPEANAETGTQEFPTRLEMIVAIASRTEQPLNQIAGTVSAIERDQRQQHLVENLQDLVRYEPGLSAPEDATRFGHGGVTIRGVDGNRIGMTVDGIPLREGFSVGSFSRSTRDAVDPALLSQIEVLRGPASTLYGSDALGGIVAYRSLGVDDVILEDDENFAGEFGLGSMGRDDSVFASAVAASRWDRADLLVGHVDRHGDQRENNPRPGKLKANPQQRDGQSWLVKFGTALTPNSRLELNYNARQTKVQTDVQSLVYGPAQYSTTNAMLGDDRENERRASLSWMQQTPWLGIEQLDAKLYWQDSALDQVTQQWRDAVGTRTPATRRDREFWMDQTTKGLQLQGQKHHDGFKAQHWHVFGVDYLQSAIEELRDGTETNLATNVSTNLVLGERLPVRDFPNSKAREWGMFWQDEISWNKRFAVIPGLRYERYKTDAQNDAIFLADNPTTTVVDIDDSSLTSKLGFRFDANDAWQWFGQFAQGYRAPPMSDLNIGFTIPASNFIAIPNPNLKSETSKGLELGLRWHSESSDLEIVGFHNRYHDLIESRVNLGRNPQGVLVFQSQNRAKATIQGFEIRGSTALPWESWSLHGGLSLSEGQDTARDKPLNTIDPAKLTVGVLYQSTNGKHRVELLGTFVARKDEIDATTTPFETPGFGLLDVFWQYQVTDALVIDAGLFNLTDRRHWLWSSVRGMANDAREVDLATQPGRNFGMSLQYRF